MDTARALRVPRRKRGESVPVKFLYYLLLTALAVILIFPFLFMVSKSLMTQEEALQKSVVLWPAVPRFANYVDLIAKQNLVKPFLNTLYVVVFNCIAIPLTASMSAFAFSKLKFIGKNVLFAIMMSTVMLPAIVTQIPLYSMYVDFGWIGKLHPLTIPNLFGGGAMNIFLIRQFMFGVPKDLDNAAKIDGAGVLRRFAAITIPLCLPILAYIAVMTFMTCWGDFYGPSVYVSSVTDKFTLAYKVYLDSAPGLGGSLSSSPELKMASGVVISVIPTILFFLFQKQLVEGISTIGIKG